MPPTDQPPASPVRFFRRPGARWRLLVQEYDPDPEAGTLYGTAHHVEPGAVDVAEDHTQVHGLPANTEFDELVVSPWLHVEGKDDGRWWANIGGVTVWVDTDRDGRPGRVSVYGPGDYADPVDGCEYEVTWTGREALATDTCVACQLRECQHCTHVVGDHLCACPTVDHDPPGRAVVAALCDRLRAVTGQRDRARNIAVTLEQQLAEVARIHHRTPGGYCRTCDDWWPCNTAQAIGADE